MPSSRSPPPPPRASATTEAGARTDFTIACGQTVDLPGGTKLRFDRHGHKDVTPDMGPSPLIIRGALIKPGGASNEFHVNVQLEQSRRFTVNGEEFELVDHAYDEWMHLRYLGRAR